MTYPADGDWWCEDSSRIPHRAPQGSRRCEVHAREYKRYQDRTRVARARFEAAHPGDTYQPPPYVPTGQSKPAAAMLYPVEMHELGQLRESLDAAVTRVRRLQRGRARPDESALHLADLADRVAELLQQFSDRATQDARARAPAPATVSTAPARTSKKARP